MKKLPSDAFLPTGAFNTTDHPFAVGDSYLNQGNPNASNGPDAVAPPAFSSTQPFRPLHPSVDASAISPSTSPSKSTLHPHFRYMGNQIPTDASSSSIRRSSSLSPTSTGPSRAPASPHHALSSPAGSGPIPSLGVATSLSRSASADAVAPQQTSLHLVQRLAQQNSLIREAWEAERNYLEANRQRAEQVYQEERAIMEDIRDTWNAEKAAMEREMLSLRERLRNLEAENTALRTSGASSQQQPSGIVSPPPSSSHTNGAKDPSPLDPSVSAVDSASLPPGLEGAARRPHFASPGGGSRHSPTRHYEASPFAPIDPRTQPQTSSDHDFLASPEREADFGLPTIDVQEIDPNLEGIPIKASAFQRSTFSQTSSKASPATSPPPSDSVSMAQQDSSAAPRRSSKEHTLQALSAGESRRRTMHAGHTPNHSISLFPSMTAADGTSTTAQSEATTPTAPGAPAPDEDSHETQESGDAPKDTEAQDLGKYTDQPEPELTSASELDEQEPPFEPEDDMPLKGPLMIKNIPAQDELFWEQVNKKLEPISHGEDALPSVMRGQKRGSVVTMKAAPVEISVGMDGANDLHDEPRSSEGIKFSGTKTVEPDVPLKLRTTTNFGAPFGAFGR